MGIDRQDPDGTNDFLDGLAGRGGDTGDAQEGARLRNALLPERWVPAPLQPPWAAAQSVVRPGEAANDGREWRRAGRVWAIAASAVLVIGWGVLQVSDPESDGERARGQAGGPHAIWLQAEPGVAAEELAKELRLLGAAVVVRKDVDLVVLSIDTPPQARAAVAARLATIEVGLDAQGRAQLAIKRVGVSP